MLSLFGLRFWSFGAAFFGLTGVILHLIGGPALAVAAPLISAGVGVAAGLGASTAFRALARDTIGQVKGASALVGREGRLLLPVARAQRGKVRMPVPGGGHLDLLAESDDDDALDAGVDVLIVEVRGNVAIVERAPACAARWSILRRNRMEPSSLIEQISTWFAETNLIVSRRRRAAPRPCCSRSCGSPVSSTCAARRRS